MIKSGYLKHKLCRFVKVTKKLRISQESLWSTYSVHLSSVAVQENNVLGLNASDCNLWISEVGCLSVLWTEVRDLSNSPGRLFQNLNTSIYILLLL